MKLICTQPFAFAHEGVRVEHFEVGQVIETDDEQLVEVATDNGWAKPETATKARTAAPENKRRKAAQE